MKNKNLLIGGAVLIGIVLYLRSRNKANDTDETRSVDAGGGLGGVGGGAMAQENGGGAVMQTGQPVVVAQPKKTPPATPPATPTSQLSKFEVDTRVFKSCGIMPPSFQRKKRNLWDDCKDRTKADLRGQGLISFNGMNENNASGLDFDGNIID
jgi:hypothetical protein